VVELEESQDPSSIKRKLGVFLGVDLRDKKRADVIQDFHFYNYAFCKDNAFSAEKTSCFVSIVGRVVQADQGTNTGNVGDSFALFKNLLLKHSVERPPYSVGIFSPTDVGKITDYIMNSYYRHFNLYKFIFTKKTIARLQQSQECDVSEVRVPRPLYQAMEHLAPPVVPPQATKLLSQSKVSITHQEALLG
jgi:hypothetical protein